MRNDARIQSRLESSLREFETRTGALPGIDKPESRATFVKQLIDSIRRVEYVRAIDARNISPNRADPFLSLFDPLKAAILHKRLNSLDEACWLTFLAIHCGKHGKDGWKLVRTIYANENTGGRWSWATLASHMNDFRESLDRKRTLKNTVRGRFGNHRHYESLAGRGQNGTGAAVQSYFDWVTSNGGHHQLFEAAITEGAGDQAVSFDYLYQNMRKNVVRFSRLGVFDFLCMLGKLGLTDITPGTPYLRDSTGPLKGAKLLTGVTDIALLNRCMTELGESLAVHMQVIEDSLCNWQKSPDRYKQFRG